MATILVIAESDFTANAIDQALTQRGHLVTTATDFNDIGASCGGLIFDLVVLSQNIAVTVKQAIILQVRGYCAGAPIIDMCVPGERSAGADYSLTSDSFEALSASVTAVLKQEFKRKTG